VGPDKFELASFSSTHAIPWQFQLREVKNDMGHPASTEQGGKRRVNRPVGTMYMADGYFFLIQAPWIIVVLSVLLAYLLGNALFALIYMAGGDCITGVDPGAFSDNFFFSVQTMSTIGYGAMAPKTTYAHVAVTVEALTGLLGFAMATGLMFAKYSRPRSMVLFSDKAVITNYYRVPSLMFRLANARSNEIVEASIRVTALCPDISPEGFSLLRLHDLKLQRSQTPIFRYTWVVIHPIDEDSILLPYALKNELHKARIIVTAMGFDGTYGQTVHASYTYEGKDVRWGESFVDALESLDDGTLLIDFENFHTTQASEIPTWPDTLASLEERLTDEG